MRSIDLLVESSLQLTPRVKQLSGMFDVPAKQKLSHHWKGEIPIDERPWNVGLIVGPSGAGKSSVARQLFGEEKRFTWGAASVIDDFEKRFAIQDITDICSAVGFNTIPSWMKPFAVLSTGEKFRVDLARRLIDGDEVTMVDEFTSVVDRQVAQVGSHAVQKYIRNRDKKFVAVTCHYDVVDWLQPDWILEPATMQFQWRSLRGRPALNVEIARVDYSAWNLFSQFHYLTSELHRAARCYVLFVNGYPASFAGILHRPHPTAPNIKGLSRGVTLPDYQGLGLAFVLFDTLSAAYKAVGDRMRLYPAHPSFVRSADRSKNWSLEKAPGVFGGRNKNTGGGISASFRFGGRPNAVFEYCGPAMSDILAAKALISGDHIAA